MEQKKKSSRTNQMIFKNWAVVIVLFLLTAGCGGGKVVSKEQFGERLWPLTEPKGTLSCTWIKQRGWGGKHRVIKFSNIYGDHYALNEYAKKAGYRSIDPIRQTDPNDPSRKKDLSVLREEGKKMCGTRR
jgi:hypothetical protein